MAEHVDFKPRFSTQKENPLATNGIPPLHQEITDLAEAAMANSLSLEMKQPELCEAVF